MPPRELAEVFSATVSDVRPIAAILRALSFRSTAVLEISHLGIKITVEEGRAIQANAYLKAETFKSYQVNLPDSNRPISSPTNSDDENSEAEEFLIFGISLSTMLECLNIFGNATAIGGTGKEWNSSSDRVKARWSEEGGGTANQREEQREKISKAEETGKVTSMRLSYSGEGEPLILLLEESGIVTRCELTTYEADELMQLAFDDEIRVQKLIMKSEWLRDALSELDPTSERVTFSFSPADAHIPTPYNRYGGTRRGKHSAADQDAPDSGENSQELGTIFRLESVGTLGSTEMDYPNDRDVLETYECETLISNSYKFSHVQLTLKALIASSKTSIRTQNDGLISFQFMIPVSAARTKSSEMKHAFVEFLLIQPYPCWNVQCVALDM